MKINRKPEILLFVAAAWLLLTPFCLLARPVQLAATDLQHVHRSSYCGKTETAWVPGELLRNGKFQPYSSKLRHLRRKLRKNRKVEPRRLRRKLRKAKRKLKRTEPECLTILSVPTINLPEAPPLANTATPPTATAMPSNTAVPSTETAMPTGTAVPPIETAMPTSTTVPSTVTAIPTSSAVPPTETAVPASTAVPPIETAEPTSTAVPPTVTAMPTSTTVPPTATAMPTNTAVPPTATAIALPTNTTAPLLLSIALVDPCTNREVISSLSDGGSSDFRDAARNATLVAYANGEVGSIVFSIDGNVEAIESAPPYALFGQKSKDLLAGRLPLGTHTVLVEAYSKENGEGDLIGSYKAEQTFLDSSPLLDEEPYLTPGNHLVIPGKLANFKSMDSGCLRVGYKTPDEPVVSDIDFKGELQSTVELTPTRPFEKPFFFDFGVSGEIVVSEAGEKLGDHGATDFEIRYFTSSESKAHTWTEKASDHFNLAYNDARSIYVKTAAFGVTAQVFEEGYTSQMLLLSKQGELLDFLADEAFLFDPVNRDDYVINFFHPDAVCTHYTLLQNSYSVDGLSADSPKSIFIGGEDEKGCLDYQLAYHGNSRGLFGVYKFAGQPTQFFSLLKGDGDDQMATVELEAFPVSMKLIENRVVVLFQTDKDIVGPSGETLPAGQLLAILDEEGVLKGVQPLALDFRVERLYPGIGAQIYAVGTNGEIQLLH